jgi:hypothetical protein
VPEPYAATSYRTASHDDGGSTDKHAKHADKHRAHRGR